MEFLKIVGLAILAGVIYGVAHDQVTARICVEYFTVFHPPVFNTQSPTLLAFGWGIIATWWVGVFLGVCLAISCRVGPSPKIDAAQLVRPIGYLLLAMVSCALIAGIVGYFWGQAPDYFRELLAPSMQRRFLADWWAHSASYASGFFGGMVLCVVMVRKRMIGSKSAFAES